MLYIKEDNLSVFYVLKCILYSYCSVQDLAKEVIALDVEEEKNQDIEKAIEDIGNQFKTTILKYQTDICKLQGNTFITLTLYNYMLLST